MANPILDTISLHLKWIIGTALVLILFVGSWLLLTKGVNGVKDFVFWKQANKKQAEAQAQIDKIAPLQKAFDQTLIERAQLKEALSASKKESDLQKEIFTNDALTAKQKVKAFEDSQSNTPTITDPTGVTIDELCARAKSAGGSPQVIAALCPAGN